MATAEIIVSVVDRSSAGIASIDRSLNKMNKTSAGAIAGINALGAALAGAFAGISIGAIANTLDGITNLDNRLRLVTNSSEELEAAFEGVLDVSNRTRTPIQENVNLFSRLAQANENLGLTQNELLQVTENLGKALQISGADANETSSAILQFSQAMAGGVLRGEEFNAVNEAAPRVMQALADQLGVTRGELRQLAEDGLLRADVVAQALLASTEELNEEFNRLTPTISSATTVLANQFTTALRDLGGSEVGGMVAKVILLIADNVEILIGVLTPLAVLLGTAIVVAIGTFITATLPISGTIIAITVAIGAAIGAFISFKDTLVDFAGRVIDGVVNAFQNFVGVMKGLWAAIKDPTNATEAYNNALEEHRRQLQDTSTEIDGLVDGLNETTTATGENTDQVEINTQEVNRNEQANNNNRTALNNLRNQLQETGNAYDQYTSSLERNTYLSSLSNDERDIQIELEKALEALARSRGVAITELTDVDKKQTEEYVRGQLAQQKANEERERSREEFARRTDRLIQESYEATTTTVQRLEQEKQEYLRTARQLGLEDHQNTMDAMLEYDRQIIQAQIEERDRYVQETKSEYSNLYGFLEEKLVDMTGLTRREFGIMSDVAKLVFGVDIPDLFDQMFATGISAITGLRTGGQQQFSLFPGIVQGPMNQTGQIINGTFAQTGLGAVTGFVGGAFDLLVAFASDIGGVFGSLGNSILNAFSGLFSGLGSGISGLFGQLGTGAALGAIGGNSLGGTIGSVLGTAIFGPIGGLIGGLFGGFFAEGGYIPPGSFGVVGEAGPEIINGPAQITSVTDTADIFSNMGRGTQPVNVTFNINTIDARGFEQMLYDNRQSLADMFRSAIENRPNQTLRGVY